MYLFKYFYHNLKKISRFFYRALKQHFYNENLYSVVLKKISFLGISEHFFLIFASLGHVTNVLTNHKIVPKKFCLKKLAF